MVIGGQYAVTQGIHTRFVKEYVEANSLNITAYQDYGSDPLSLNSLDKGLDHLARSTCPEWLL